MKRLFELFFVALLAVGMAVGYQFGFAAFSTFEPPVTNNFTEHYFQELRGYKMVGAVAGSESDGATTTVAGMEAGDVILDVINTSGGVDTLVNVDESGYTAASGGAVLDTSITEPTQGDGLIFLFVDVDNTN